MKRADFFVCLIIFLSLATVSYAQFAALPPSATVVGVNLQPIGSNAGIAHWQSSAGLGAYNLANDNYSDPILPNSTDSRGRTWQNQAPSSVLSARNALDASGGIVRVIYLGESAGAINDFGYTLSGNPAGPQSYTLFKDIQSVGPAANVQFGDYFDISVLAGQFGQFDFWYNSGISASGFIPDPKPGLFEVYGLWGDAAHANQFIWSESPIAASTYVYQLSTYAPFDTYLVGVEDWAVGGRSDRDYSDFRFGLQFLNATATAAIIPEPAATSTLIGLVALGLLLTHRWARNKFGPQTSI